VKELDKFLLLSQDDLETTQLLCDCGRYRSAISRAYYAMYYVTQALLLSQGLDTSTHKGVLKLLSFHFVKTGKLSTSIADLLRDAYSARQDCDYDSILTEDEAMARLALANAHVYISEIKKLLC